MGHRSRVRRCVEAIAESPPSFSLIFRHGLFQNYDDFYSIVRTTCKVFGVCAARRSHRYADRYRRYSSFSYRCIRSLSSQSQSPGPRALIDLSRQRAPRHSAHMLRQISIQPLPVRHKIRPCVSIPFQRDASFVQGSGGSHWHGAVSVVGAPPSTRTLRSWLTRHIATARRIHAH